MYIVMFIYRGFDKIAIKKRRNLIIFDHSVDVLKEKHIWADIIALSIILTSLLAQIKLSVFTS